MKDKRKEIYMPYVKVGTENNEDILVSYADYGNPDGDPVVLIHGWPLSHRMWEKQILALTEAGKRVIAYDRRGFGESYKPWGGYDYDTLAADLSALLDKLDVTSVTLVGFSMGGGEVARYLSTYGSDRIAKAVLMSAVTPYMLKTEDNPDGVDQSIFDGMAAGMLSDRPKFLEEFSKSFFNWDSDGKDLLSEQALRHAWDVAVWASPKATLACAQSFATTDFRDDLKAFSIPTLILHGDADQTVPFESSGKLAHELISGSELVVISGGAHGLTYTRPDEVNEALLSFINK